MVTSPELKTYLVTELMIAADKIEESTDVTGKLFYFSAAFGAFARVLNIEFDPKLVLLHNVYQSAHTAVNNRMQALKDQRELGVGFDPAVFSVLADLTRKTAIRIKGGEDVTDLLERLSVVTFTTTGNGYYLYTTNRITSWLDATALQPPS